MKSKLLYILVIVVLQLQLTAQQQLIQGVITNHNGQPLPGTTILVKNTTLGTTTNESGQYAIQVPKENNVLVFVYVGFASQEVEINGRNIIDVSLEKSVGQLEEVIVIGFGTQKTRSLTSSISSIDQTVFEQNSSPNFQRALQGRLPGVVITNASGGLNAEAIIRIRGTGSINAGNQPLMVVDGLVLAAQPGSDLGYTTNPLIGFDPNDIASVEVLKDAAAAAIYGSRGSNGVILITTKSGEYNQKSKVHLGYYSGFSQIAKKQDLLNTEEYVMLWNEASSNVGNSQVDHPELFYPVGTEPYTDWQKLLLRKGFVQEATASISGGTPTNKYYFSGSVRDEDHYLRTIGIKRYSMRANFEQKLSDKVTTGISINPSRTVDNRTGNQWAGSAFGFAQWYAPNFSALDENGACRKDILLSTNGQVGGFPGNPCTVLEDQLIERIRSQVLLKTHLAWSPIPNLELRTEWGTELSQEHGNYRFGAATLFGAPTGVAGSSFEQVLNYNWTNLINWRHSWADQHQVDLTTGVHLTKATIEGIHAFGSGFFDDRLRYLDAAAATSAESRKTASAFIGYLARINYALRDKYLLTFTARYDGSSRFGVENRYGFFPALSAGWIISDESFFPMKNIAFLKLRSSIGLTGNAQIGNFASRGLVDFSPAYVGESGYIIHSIENENLSWEKNRLWDIGIEFGLWNNRITGSVAYYIKDTKDLLLEQPVPANNGISFLTSNVGEIRNQGLEFELSADIISGLFDWNVQVNGATLKNEVIRLVDQNGDGTEEDIILLGRVLFRPGESIASHYLQEYAGVDPKNGNALFFDNEGNTIANSSPGTNRRIAGKSIPSFTGGFTHQFRYKNFDLSAFFHFKTGYKIYMEDRNLEGSFFGGNMHLATLNRWTPDNTNTDVPQVRLNVINGSQVSTRYLDNGSFLRLQYLTLGYTFHKIGSNSLSLRVFAAAQNLLTFTPFRGLDPDSEFGSPEGTVLGTVRYNLPGSKTYTFGFTLDL